MTKISADCFDRKMIFQLYKKDQFSLVLAQIPTGLNSFAIIIPSLKKL